jgi:hypothetical protein
MVSRERWGVVRAIIYSPSAAAAGMRWLARHHGGVVAARVADAAFGGGRWDYTDLTARKAIAFHVFEYLQARITLYGRSQSGRARLGLCMRGVPRTLLCKLLADPFSPRPIALATLSGRTDRWSGYISRGVEALVHDVVQVPAVVAEGWEIGRTGYAMNRYWLASSMANKPALESLEDAAAAHVRGFAIVENGPVRVTRVTRVTRDEELRAAIEAPS